MIRQLILITWFLFFKTIFFAQGNPNDTTSFIDRHKYLKFLFEPADDRQATLLTIGWQYLYCPPGWGKTFRTGGMHPSIGINLARFFSNKFVLGVFADLKGLKGFTQQRLSPEFRNDFNNDFVTTYLSQADSARAYTVKDAVNGVPAHGFWGNYYGDYGLMFSPFPQKYGGVLISIKKGYRGYPTFGTYGNKYLNDGERENILLDFSGTYSFIITCKPSTFFRKGGWIGDLEPNDLWQFITIGFYYEKLQLKNATFDGMPFDKMVNPGFISKYGVDNRFGITFGLALY